MGLDLNETTITKSGTSLVITNSNTSLTFDNGGRLIKGNYHPMFYASHTVHEWASSATSASWLGTQFTTVEINQNNCFNTSTFRFTAPVTGIYIFTSNSYHYSNGMPYCYSMFFVNGGGNRVPSYPIYRIYAYNKANGYSFDIDISQIYYLIAGDYVQPHVYLTNGTIYFLQDFAHFAGYLLG